MLWFVFSCEEFCEEQNRTAVVISFYDDDGPLKDGVKAMIKGIENDSLLYDGKSSYTQVMLPVNPAADFMSFSIKNDTFPADTIIINYIRHNGFISPKCGCVTYAEIQGEPEKKGKTMTQMVVTNPNVTTVSYRQRVFNAENIRIYY